jgi:hypothetical protein
MHVKNIDESLKWPGLGLIANILLIVLMSLWGVMNYYYLQHPLNIMTLWGVAVSGIVSLSCVVIIDTRIRRVKIYFNTGPMRFAYSMCYTGITFLTLHALLEIKRFYYDGLPLREKLSLIATLGILTLISIVILDKKIKKMGGGL